MILLNGQFADDLIPQLERSMRTGRYEGAGDAELGCAEILVTRGKLRVDSSVLDRLPSLRLVIKAGAGLDTIDVAAATARGIAVRATGGSEDSVAELALALTLCCLRNLTAFDRAVRRLDWASKTGFVGATMASRHVGVIGFGRIGRAYAAKAAALGAEVSFWDRSPGQRDKAEFAARIGATSHERLSTLVAAADVLSLHVPLTGETRSLLGTREFSSIRRETILINTARAEVVNRDCLMEALATGRLAAAGLDVHYLEGKPSHDPLYDLPNVVLTPHVGAQTHDAQRAISSRIVALVRSHAASAAEVEP